MKEKTEKSVRWTNRMLREVEKNLTQKQLAVKLGTKQSVLSRVENAKTTPTVSFLKRLADVLGMNLKIEFS